MSFRHTTKWKCKLDGVLLAYVEGGLQNILAEPLQVGLLDRKKLYTEKTKIDDLHNWKQIKRIIN